MKTIKSLTALFLFAAASISNAAVWDVEVSADTYFPSAFGTVVYNAQGTWNDQTQQGALSGDLALTSYNAVLHLVNQSFSMDVTTGQGELNQAASCTDNLSGTACTATGTIFFGSLFNDITFGGTPDTSSASPFVPSDGSSYTWTLLIAAFGSTPTETIYRNYPLTVTLHATAPTVPVPAAAWLFGSSVLSLAGMNRRQNRAGDRRGRR